MSALGTPRLHLRRVDSTNRRARELAAAGAPHGTLVTAVAQSAGRGRQGRAWTTPPGRALLASLVIRSPPPLLSLLAGLAVAEVAEELDAGGRRALVKWPNDVLLDGGKAAGILVEGRPLEGWAVLGVGLNVALGDADLPPELAGRATGLGRAPEMIEVALVRLLTELTTLLGVPRPSVLARLRDRDALRGRTVRWAGGEGTAAGIDASGGLRVTGPGGTLVLDAGEVHLKR